MTRKEILEWGREMADKIFHKKKDEMTVKGWVARDENGALFYHSAKPYKQYGALFNQWMSDDSLRIILLLDDMLPSVKWEDKEPTPCEITIKLK